MHPIRATTIAAGLHGALALAAVYYTLRIHNQATLSEISIRDFLVMGAIVVSPLVSAWVGLRLARSALAHWILAAGQTLALILFGVTFVAVVRSVEPLAPLLFVLAGLWIAGGLAMVLVVVWLVGWRRR